MNLNELKPAAGAVRANKRLGRGQGSGRGGTSTRGHKGAKSRSGFSIKIGFEGGQMPLQRRVPKFGFTNPNRVEYRAINLDVLQTLATDKGLDRIDASVLIANGLANKNDLIKILGRGEFTAKVSISALKFSASAVQAIEAAGGTIEQA